MTVDAATLAERLGGATVLSGHAVQPYLRDASSVEAGDALAVVLARDTGDVVETMRWASEHAVPVTVRGAGSGLAGGATAIEGGILLSTAQFDRILEIRPGDRVAVVQPGVVLDDLDRAAREHGLTFAPDPASSGLATIGGAIATNAGGFHCLGHGVTGDAVAALELVLADGRVLRTGAASRKNVAGYDLARLIVGAEGTLAVVTEATVRLEPIAVGESVTFSVGFPSTVTAGAAVAAVMASPVTPELLELIDRTTARIVEANMPSGLDAHAAATLIGQVVGSDASAQVAILRQVIERAGGTGFQASPDDSLLEARRRVHPSLAAHGMGVAWMSSDAAVPPSRLGELLTTVDELQRRTSRMISVVAHAGDGNIHAAISAQRDDPIDVAAAELVVERIAREAVRLGGTITGEHGVGTLKRDLLDLQFDETNRELFARIKAAFDPAGILNPGRAI